MRNIGLEALYNADNNFLRHPEITLRIQSASQTLATRIALRTALARSQSSALRFAGATEECVFAIAGVEFPADVGADEREIGIACMSRTQAEAFQRLLSAGRGRLETYEAFERAGFDEAAVEMGGQPREE
jgi:hypothetical protein